MNIHVAVGFYPIKTVGDLKRALADLPDDTKIPEEWKGQKQVPTLMVYRNEKNNKLVGKPFIAFTESEKWEVKKYSQPFVAPGTRWSENPSNPTTKA